MRRRGTPVSREALYEEVWTDAVTVVAPRYGLSDVGLVKICKKLGIPVPPRGYWAKLKAGRPTRKVPLPSLPAGARDPSGPIPLSEQEAAMHARVRDVLQQTRESQSNISVPAELVDPHPLVCAAAARLKKRDGWDHPAGVRSAPKEVLDLQVTRNTLDRALRLMDTLLKSLEPSGFTARVDEEKGETLLVGGGTTLTISIVEQVTRTSHTPTRSEVRARDRYYDSFRVGARGEYPHIPQFDWHPTGRLTLTVGSWPSRKWNDTERSLIDSRLSGIVAAIAGMAAHFSDRGRWRIERDYQELKQELGLGHFEGRGWRGFHHHAVLSIAAYGFLVSERLRTDKITGSKKNAIVRQIPSLPTDYIARGSSARATTRTGTQSRRFATNSATG